MITIMMNKNRGLTYSISCPAMDILYITQWPRIWFIMQRCAINIMQISNSVVGGVRKCRIYSTVNKIKTEIL